ncbi:MAG: DUF2804 domain-containing protein [Dehalococcoidia bacterium]|nr:DUF2804 domain-containing protein [Dehalococcoidia bacterium]
MAVVKGGAKMVDYVERELLAAPDSLVEDGQFHFGTFKNQFRQVNPLDAKIPLGCWLPRPLLAFRLKEWQAFQMGNDRWFVLAVLYNAKVSALAQFVAYDRLNKRRYIFEKILPSWKVKVPDNIWSASQLYRDRQSLIEIVSHLGKGRFYINVKVDGNSVSPAMEAHFEAFHDDGQVGPVVVSIPFGRNRGMYSHKCLMPMQGSMHIGDERAVFLRSRSFAVIDDHKGFYPYVMKYDWLTAAAYDEQKRLIGFNLTDNQSLDPEKYNENCLWINGKLDLLPAVKFTRSHGDEGDWAVRDSYGMVDLVFKPEVMGEINMNMLALKVRYRGPFGYCNGTITAASGERVEINDYFGMGEDKYIRG